MASDVEAILAANAVEDKIKMSNLCEEVEDVKEEQNRLYEKLKRVKMENKIDEKIEEAEKMNGIIPTMPLGNNGWGEGGTLMGLILGAALGGGGFGGWGNRGAAAGFDAAALAASQGQQTAEVIGAVNSAANNAVNQALNTNAIIADTERGTLIMGKIGETAAATALGVSEIRTGQQQQANYISGLLAGLSDKLCNMGMVSASETREVLMALNANGRLTDGQFATISREIAAGNYAAAVEQMKCCCETNRNIDNTRASLSREMEQGFCATNANILASENRILGKMADYHSAALEKENCILRGELSQERQTSAFQRSQDEQTKVMAQMNTALTAIALRLGGTAAAAA